MEIAVFSSRQTISSLIKTFPPRLVSASKRFYYADYYASLPKNEARIVIRDEQCVELQAFTSAPAIGQWLFTPNTPRKKIFGRDWSNILVIKNDQINFDDSYQLKEFIRSGVVALTRPLAKPPYTIFLKELYAIPQTVWESFIDKLKEKTIVEKLNLKKHRHLWSAYNNTFNPHSQRKIGLTQAQRIKHAEIIGNYHFMISLLEMNYPSPFVRGVHFSREPENIWEVMFKEYYFILNNYFSDTANPMERLSQFHPCFTPLFYKKVAHVADIHEVLRLADMVMNYGTTYKIMTSIDYVDQKRRQDAINWLPSSQKKPIEMATAIKTAKSMSDMYFGGLFFSARQSWHLEPDENSIEQSSTETKDYLEALFADLIPIEAHREIDSPPGYIPSDSLNSIKHQFRQMITDTSAYSQMLALQTRWHRNIFRVDAAKPIASRMESWQPLIDDLIIDEINIKAITSEFELQSHGKEMSHCVGGYVDKCLQNRADIIKMSDLLGGQSTLEICRDSEGVFRKNQHRSHKNSDPLAAHKQAGVILIRGLNTGTIKPNANRLKETPRRFTTKSSNYNRADREKMYETYKALKLLPARLIANDYQAMLLKIGFDDLVKTTVEACTRLGARPQ